MGCGASASKTPYVGTEEEDVNGGQPLAQEAPQYKANPQVEKAPVKSEELVQIAGGPAPQLREAAPVAVALAPIKRKEGGAEQEEAEEKVRLKAGKLGIVRLDYDYPAAPGDIDNPASFPYEVVYKVVPGLTFELIQQEGQIPPEILNRVDESIMFLEQQGVSGITGDCGFMMYLQQGIRRTTKKPVFVSALAQVPTLDTAYSLKEGELIAVLTANGESLKPMRGLIREECGIDAENKRFVFVGCENVPGFEAVALGQKVNVKEVTPGIVALVKEVIARYDNQITCIVMECTELPPYSDAVRFATGLPVYDAITVCDYFMSGFQDNERFGLADWQHVWDHEYEKEYTYGQNVKEREAHLLIHERHVPAALPEGAQEGEEDVAAQAEAALQDADLAQQPAEVVAAAQEEVAHEGAKAIKVKRRRKNGMLGIIRLDYDYPAAPGDIDSEESFPYEVRYHVVPGLTFEVCQQGHPFPPDVMANFRAAIHALEGLQVSAITGDCGFMMYLQQEARRITSKPVFMSALAQLPMLDTAYSMARGELIMVLTANGDSLRPMKEMIRDECGIDTDDGQRFVFVGCEDVPGFEAVALGEKVDVEKVTPGIVKKVQDTRMRFDEGKIRCILMECTELPPYSDAVRAATGLPVYDAITMCDYFMSGFQDNERFGLDDWQYAWDGKRSGYQFGDNLDERQKLDLVNKDALAEEDPAAEVDAAPAAADVAAE